MSTLIYAAIVEGDQHRGYSAFFPDLPGCVTGADTMLELLGSARDALTLHLQGMAEDGQSFPEPTPIEEIKHDPEIEEVGRILIDADVEDPLVRVNISIGGQFLRRVDLAAEARNMTRSGFLIEGAKQLINGRVDRDHSAPAPSGARILEVPAYNNPGRHSRYLIVPCADAPDLAVIWDRLEEAVIDVISAAEEPEIQQEAAEAGRPQSASEALHRRAS